MTSEGASRRAGGQQGCAFEMLGYHLATFSLG